MALGTKNRQMQQAAACKQHLRQSHLGQLPLVEEYIAELEGPEEDFRCWSQRFSDERRVEAEMVQRADEAFQKWMDGG